jgi:quercetin dioxygenase-like cupin family protein
VYVVTPSEERTTRTAAGTVTALAAPSQGATDLSSWRATMAPGAKGPVHSIDREQVWMVLSGAFTLTQDGDEATVAAGQAVVVPAHVVRQVLSGPDGFEAIVCMPAGGRASVPGTDGTRPLPWAQ